MPDQIIIIGLSTTSVVGGGGGRLRSEEAVVNLRVGLSIACAYSSGMVVSVHSLTLLAHFAPLLQTTSDGVLHDGFGETVVSRDVAEPSLMVARRDSCWPTWISTLLCPYRTSCAPSRRCGTTSWVISFQMLGFFFLFVPVGILSLMEFIYDCTHIWCRRIKLSELIFARFYLSTECLLAESCIVFDNAVRFLVFVWNNSD